MLHVSHRERRVARDLATSAYGMAGLTVALAAVTLAAPWSALRFGALIGLAAAGGFFLWRIEGSVRGYERDVDAVTAGSGVAGDLRAEVDSDVGLEDRPEVPSPPTPGRRGIRRGDPPPEATRA